MPPHPVAETAPVRPSFARWLSASNSVTGQFLAVGASRDHINLGGGLPDPALYPLTEIEAAARRALDRHGRDILNYGPVAGLPELRRAIAARMHIGGSPCSPDNVMITCGSMQALDLIGKALIDPGDAIAAQSPTYLGALDAWRPRQPAYRLIDVAAGEAGRAERLAGAKFAYVVPNFSNPTGALVGAGMRRAILAAAVAAGVWLVEDDPYAVLYFDRAPLARIIDLDAAEVVDGVYRGSVVYLGSLSKSLVPGLRIGWVVACPEMIAALTLAKQAADLSTSPVAQAIALEVITADIVERHAPRLIEHYRRRRDAICAAAEDHLRPWFTWQRPEGGMFLWLTANSPGLDTDRVRAAALDLGVVVSPSSAFHPQELARNGLRLNFTLNDEDRLRLGVERLAEAARRVAEGRI